jgi:hypothetical protein
MIKYQDVKPNCIYRQYEKIYNYESGFILARENIDDKEAKDLVDELSRSKYTDYRYVYFDKNKNIYIATENIKFSEKQGHEISEEKINSMICN